MSLVSSSKHSVFVIIQAALAHTRRDTLKYAALLLRHGADPNAVDISGHASLTSLVRKSNSRTVAPDDLATAQLLLDSGYNVDSVQAKVYDFQYQGTSLMAAVQRRAVDYVKLLLEAGANPDIPGTCTVNPCIYRASSDWH